MVIYLFIQDVITVMFEKAVSEPTFCPIYAQLCSHLNKKLTSSPPEEPDGKEIAFTSVLLNNCFCREFGSFIQTKAHPEQSARRLLTRNEGSEASQLSGQ